jgi:hypothetical protein
MSYVDVRPGDVITADLLRRLGNPQYAAGIRCDGGIDCRQTSDGQIQITGNFRGCFVGTVEPGGTITARSGATLGSGTVIIQVKDPMTGDYVDSGMSVTVDNISSTAGGVPENTWVVCSYQDDGTPTLQSIDCGNP